MKQAEIISFVTPNKYLLDGLWFGGEKAKTAYIFIHGLASSAFSHNETLITLTGSQTAALFFNNRGHDKIGKIKRLTDNDKGYESEMVGEAYELFTDCVDDIDGAVNYLKSRGVSNIYLVGHSTGCQKSIYYLSRRGRQELIKGVVLICPMSDYSYIKFSEDPKVLERATEAAIKLVEDDRPHDLLPLSIWPDLTDAQRFLSLYTPNSVEEIFTYSQPSKEPELYREVATPTLVLLAENDEAGDRPAIEIGGWFKSNSKHPNKLTVEIIKGSLHSLTNHQEDVAFAIKRWLKQSHIT